MKLLTQLLIIGVIIIFFSNCKKKEEKIVGTWRYVYLKATDTINVQTWTFNEDNSVIQSIKSPDTLKLDTATYSIKSKIISYPDLKITGFNFDLDGTYEVLTLNKKFLIIQRVLLSNGSSGGAFLRSEFVKQ